ncbi:MAG: 50S ribosomal protein L3 N(5)-glutamine methyltransferase [Gammaproteobacteria bacterium]
MTHTLNLDEATIELETLRDLVRFCISQFNAADLLYGHGTDNSFDEAMNLVLGSIHLPPDMDLSLMNAKLTRSERRLILERLKRRIEDHVPVPYLVKEAWFGGLGFYVDERVIIPRSPIAELVEEQFNPWVEEGTVSNILDLCTGSGCIAIQTAINFPDAAIDAIDESQEALEVAHINLERFDVADQVTLIRSNLFEKVPAKQYDIIISNPPYVSEKDYRLLPNEYHHEPKMALIAEDEGLAIVLRILKEAGQYLTPKGILVVEVGYLQEKLEAQYPDAPFTWLQFENGGDGVFLLTADELHEFQSQLT